MNASVVQEQVIRLLFVEKQGVQGVMENWKSLGFSKRGQKLLFYSLSMGWGEVRQHCCPSVFQGSLEIFTFMLNPPLIFVIK